MVITSYDQHILLDSVEQFSQEVTLSTRWIRYHEHLMKGQTVRYRLDLPTDQAVRLEVWPLWCAQVGQCTPLATTKVDGEYVFTLPKTQYIFDHFRLDFRFLYRLVSAESSSPVFRASLQVTQFPDPCDDDDVCHNKGQCINNVFDDHQLHREAFTCKCASGFGGHLCEQPRPCQQHGTVCRLLGLECEDDHADFKCVCDQDERLVWKNNT